MLDIAVTTMVASEVPSAILIAIACGTPWPSNSRVTIGTMITPPPMPSSPARVPAIAPDRSNTGRSISVYLRCACRARVAGYET